METNTTLRRVILSMFVEAAGWAILLGLASVVLEFGAGVGRLWLLLPLSCLAADLAMDGVRHLASDYLTSNSPFPTWLLRQLLLWAALAVVIRTLYGGGA